MSEIFVDHPTARKLLLAAWDKLDDTSISVPPPLAAKIDAAIRAKDVGFKYIFVTGILGKLTNPKVHPRAIQAGSELVGAYDARSLCHKVVVTFEKTKGNLFGLSNEPLVGKPTRHPEHRKDNPQLKNKTVAALVHDLLEVAHKATPAEVEAMLVELLRVGRKMSALKVVATAECDVSHKRVIDFCEKFLEKSDGGARLSGVVAAYLTLLYPEHEVKSYPPSVSDKFAKTFGDVQVFTKEKELLSAFECKQRELNIDDVHHGLKKAREGGVPEYCFITANGFRGKEEAEIVSEIENAQDSLDASVVRFSDILVPWTIALGPTRREQFGVVISEILRSQMRQAAVADASADLWNNLE